MPYPIYYTPQGFDLIFPILGDSTSVWFPFIPGMHKIIMSKAFVFLNCDMGSEESIVVQMKKIFGVSQASGVSGIYDIVAEVVSDSQKGLAGIVRKLRSIDSIRSCLTMIVAEPQLDNGSRMIPI